MFKRFSMAAVIALLLTAAQNSNAQGTSSEDAKTRPNKQEIIDQMSKVGRIPAQQQNSKLDSIWQDMSVSKAPRSDFLFCIGLAYMGNYKAQKCVGSAYEKGIGIVEDPLEAYTWYAVALENQIPDKSAEEMIQGEKERLKTRLLTTYPHPTEDDLDDMVRAQKTRMAQYQEDLKKNKK